MQFRLQVLGGAGAIGTFAGYLITSGKAGDAKQQGWLRAVIPSGLRNCARDQIGAGENALAMRLAAVAEIFDRIANRDASTRTL